MRETDTKAAEDSEAIGRTVRSEEVGEEEAVETSDSPYTLHETPPFEDLDSSIMDCFMPWDRQRLVRKKMPGRNKM